MKIAYIIPKPSNTGPILVVLELVKEMSRHGHNCTVYHFDKGDEIIFPCRTQQISFFQKINFDHFDIIHTHGLRPDCYIFLHKPLKSKTLFITTLHNYIIPDFSYQYNKFIAYTIGNLWMLGIRRHDKIVTLSQDAMKYYQRRLPLQKLTYAYNTRSLPQSDPIDEQSRQKILQFKKDSFILGVNAALTDRKGIDQIIKALKELANYKLIIIGDGKSKIPLENLSVNEQVSERVLFLGYQKDAYRFLPFYDLFILPSRNEGFGLTLLESALYKKNVVCSRIPIFEELCPQGEVTFFELENISSLVKAIQTASQSPDLGNKLYQRYIQSFSPNVFYKRYNQIYNKSLEKTNKKGQMSS